MEQKNITIKNDKLYITISTLGAEMQAIKYNNEERLWDGNEKFWTGRAPLLFPICGGLKEDKYFYNGEEYSLPKHGFARRTVFEIERIEEAKVVFLDKSNENTLKVFPFEYELRVIYELIDNKIEVTYHVYNKTNGEMYFSIGAHEAYSCAEGIEEYTLEFEQEETLVSNVLKGNMLSDDTVFLGENIKELPLKYDYFKVDALTFLNLKSKSVALKHKFSNKSIKVGFEGFPYLFVWTKPDAVYLCIEPWCGIPDFENSGNDITKKTGIIKLLKDQKFQIKHTITIN